MVNHVEACFPTPSVDFVPAIFGEDEKEFALAYFSDNAREIYRTTDGSFEYSDISELYRTPVELGWKKNIKLDHDFIGRKALEPEIANPKRTMVTLVWDADDVADVYVSLFKKGTPYQYMEMPRNILGCVFADAVVKDDNVRRCEHVALLQLLFPRDAVAVRAGRFALHSWHQCERRLGAFRLAAEANSRGRRAGTL